MGQDILDFVEAEEDLLIDFQFLVHDILTSKGISKTELAKRTGISKARLSQILNAEANPSVKTFARLFHALGVKVEPRIAAHRGETPMSVPLPPESNWKRITETFKTEGEASRWIRNESAAWLHSQRSIGANK